MTTDTTELQLDITRHLPHPPERVFDAWLDPAMLTRFMTPAHGVTVPEADVDARIGGRFRIVMRTRESGDLIHAGEYLEIDRPNRLVFTWESPFTTEGSTVTIEFRASGGGTDVRLHHVRFVSEESRDNHAAGWTRILEALEHALS